MEKVRFNLLALTITALVPALVLAEKSPEDSVIVPPSSIFKESAQAQSNGFLEDSEAKILIRNFYMNRDFRNSSRNDYGAKKAQSYREEWAQGFIGTYKSGFTQGTIGFGIEAIGMYGIKLDTGRGRVGAGALPVDRNGRADDNYAKAGGVIKARLSNTILKYGEQQVDTPVFSTDDARLLPETAEGFLLTSNEIENLTINMGHFTGLKAMNQTYKDSINNGWGLYRHGSYKAGRGLKRADFIGATYQFTPNLSASLYYSDVEDFWKKKYANINYNYPINDNQAIGIDFNYYHTQSQGAVKRISREDDGHKLNSNVWSALASYSIQGHKLSMGYQRVTGHGSGNPYGVDGGGAIYLGNSVQYSDYNNENERSWQVRYDLNMSQYGVPGLSFMARYIKGSNISSHLRDSRKSGGKVSEHEHNIEAKYVVQSGAAKDLSFRLRYAEYRSSGFANDVTEVRFITEYPWDILGTFKK